MAQRPLHAILLVPAEMFFCRAIPLPTGIEASDIPQFVEISLEAIAPFPIEQMAWGYLRDPGSTRILIYAAYSNTLRQNGFGDMDRYYHALPGFIAGVVRRFEQPTVIFLYCEKGLSALFYVAGDSLPVKIISVKLAEDKVDGQAEPTPQTILDCREAMIRDHDMSGYTVDDGITCISAGQVGSDDLVCFLEKRLEPSGDFLAEQSRQLPFSVSELWQSDLRGSDFIERERKQRVTARRLWRINLLAGCAAVLLLIIQVGLFAYGIHLNRQEETIVTQTSQVERIEENLNLLDKIEQFAKQELKLFQMLQTMNNIRPQSIYFTKASADNFNQLQVIGQGNNVEEVNRFYKSLKQASGVSDVILNVTSRRGKAPFTLTVTFEAEFIGQQDVVAGSGNQPTAQRQ